MMKKEWEQPFQALITKVTVPKSTVNQMNERMTYLFDLVSKLSDEFHESHRNLEQVVGLAKTNWQTVQVHLERLNQAPITLWAEMKCKLNQFIKGLHVHINGKLAYSFIKDNEAAQSNAQIECFSCHVKDQIASQCP
ncbi:hypothetical protein TIFTF001_012875, partial [Ficus carica]